MRFGVQDKIVVPLDTEKDHNFDKSQPLGSKGKALDAAWALNSEDPCTLGMCSLLSVQGLGFGFRV